MTRQYDRFKDAPWFPQHDEMCMVGGAGGIGSWLTFFLAKAGFKPILFDFDDIEEHNIGGQLFRPKDINRPKVSAVFDIIKEFCDEEISTFNQRVDEETSTHHFCFAAFDNMKARKDLFEVWKRSISSCSVTPLFIDGRLTMEQMQIFAVTPDRIQQYEEHLFDDSEVEDAACTLKQTSHTAAMIAGHMTSIFTNHITNIYERAIHRDVPFYYEFYGPVTLTNVR